ncbi:Rhodanese-like protein [Rhizopus microsporus var. microsporus]|uniref:Rhodanese-like protein n=2 Tax=Rhizopus microsporus TaxID=58291 RepID=A0A2G4T3P1_RHIZD|nr:Rhodanese-like protein [Rhizopus microsporus ATCC 52813]ORE08740.1 Rhodanese-like protein [Rhizopus microsporus var. microsporus]PHZ15630.1 Rhodanese-like protein [Rhizopus microsporus ATCC 52813]
MTDLITHIPTSELSTCTPALRNQPVSKIENYDPTTYKTLAFYKFHDFTQPQLEELREKLLIDLGELGIVGRIYISKEGINAQMACPEECLPKLQEYVEKSIKPLVGGDLMDLNLGTEHGKRSFRALHVRIRKQLIVDGLDPSSYNLNNVPSHLSPAEWHEKLSTYEKQHGKKPILIDMRNHYESNIGFFEGAIRPDADTYKDCIKAMNEICAEVPRDEEIFMYCTGGIRCTKAGAILQSASGFKKVHLVDGGITAYGRWIAEQEDKESLFKGKNFTFDARMGEKITDDVFGKCQICGQPCNRYQNCSHSSCNILMLCCPSCSAQFLNTCARLKCYDTVHEFVNSASELFKPDGPVMVNGVRAFVKQGEKNMDKESSRVVIGKQGVKCDNEHNRRIRAIEVLGEPGEVLKEWAKAGRDLPPKPDVTMNSEI